MTSLYRRVLGEAFESLPPVLRDFHDRERGGFARGALRVTRGKGRLRDALATGLRLPASGTRVPLQLRVIVEGERERWVREFGQQRIETVQWARAGLLIEAMGHCRFGFRITGDAMGMRFRSLHAWICGVPLPKSLAVRVDAVIVSGEHSWHVHVELMAPLLGRLLSYEGEITPG